MPIPETQLETWARPGASATAKTTHESIRAALTQNLAVPGPYEIFLQGSYKNDTNIRGDSDVDVVVQFNGSWERDISGLTTQEQGLYLRTYPDAVYVWTHFRRDVLAALRTYYGTAAVDDGGSKSLKLRPGRGRLAADIVAALHFRDYIHFNSSSDESYHDGIQFYSLTTNDPIINFPKLHYTNGVTKNGETEGWYKPSVRMFKNARTYLIDHGELPKNVAPSYFVECWLSNVPSNLFGPAYQDAFAKVLRHLAGCDWRVFACQHGRHLLFGPSAQQWKTQDAMLLLQKLGELWDNWYH